MYIYKIPDTAMKIPKSYTVHQIMFSPMHVKRWSKLIAWRNLATSVSEGEGEGGTGVVAEGGSTEGVHFAHEKISLD